MHVCLALAIIILTHCFADAASELSNRILGRDDMSSDD